MEKKFNSMSVGMLVLRLGIPAMLAQFFNVLYSVVDRIFVGSIEGYGELALAGIGVCAPLLTAISAFANMAGVGGSAILSVSLGRKDKKTAQKTINNAFLMLIFISIAVTALCLIFRRELLFTFGCSEKMYPYAESYFKIYISGTIASLLGAGMNQFILAQGYAKEGMYSVITGAVINVALDFIFISKMNMGIKGAAIATVVSQIAMCIYVLTFLTNKNRTVTLGTGGYNIKIIFRIIGIGTMPFLITLLDNFILILMNMSLRKWGTGETGDIYIAGAAVVQSFMTMVNCPALGITSGCGTLFGFYCGAGNYRRMMDTFKYVLILLSIFTGILMIIVQIFPEAFADIFIKDKDNIILTASFLKKYTLGLLGIAVQCTFVDGLTAMGKVKYAMPLSLFRKLLYILFITGLPYVTKLENIFYAGTLSDLLGALFTITVFCIVIVPNLRKETNINTSIS